MVMVPTQSLVPPLGLHPLRWCGLDVMINSDKYFPSQRIVDRASSTFDNELTIKGNYQDAVGNYSCNASNSISYISAQKTINGNQSYLHHYSITLSLSLRFRLALEVTGYESPIVVGLHGTLRCTTILNIPSIKWYLAATENVLESSSSSVVEYDVTPNSAGLDGTRFTCKAETVTGEIYRKTIAIEVKGMSLIYWSV